MRRVIVLIAATVMGCLTLFAWAQQDAKPKLKGVTIIQRAYERNLETGQITELGTRTSFISSQGAWRTIKKNLNGEVTQDLVADVARGGVYSVADYQGQSTASKLAEFRPQRQGLMSAGEYRKHVQFVREEEVLGYTAFVKRIKDETGQPDADIWYVPEFDVLPVKLVYYRGDHLKIYEPISITVGEPEAAHFLIPNSKRIIDTIDPALLPKPKN